MPMLRSTVVFIASSSDSFSARGLLASLSVSAVTGGVDVGVADGVGAGGVVCLVCAANSVVALKAQITANNRRTTVMKPSWTRNYYGMMSFEFRVGYFGACILLVVSGSRFQFPRVGRASAAFSRSLPL